MSGGITAMGIMAAASVASVGLSYINGQDAKRAQDKAQKQALNTANKAATQADQDMNKANQKRPDSMALLDAATQAGKSGASGTMLTGAKGVDPNALVLGKSTLLGG